MTDQRPNPDIKLTAGLAKAGQTTTAATWDDLDSAYGTATQSGRSTMTPNPSQESGRIQQQGRRIRGTDLYLFKKEGDLRVLEHYGKICDGVDALLEDEIHSAGCDPFCSMGMRVEVVGTTEQEATLRLLVFCAREVKDTVLRFFETAPVTALLNPSRPNALKLDYIVIPVPHDEDLHISILKCAARILGQESKGYTAARQSC